MSRKDYEAVATAIRTEVDLAHATGSSIAFMAALRVATSLADVFEDENDRFNRERFLQACGVSS